ncbi:hypothetical protein E2C01_077693 [Portunus trituberculatus]|uniref:Uncharacterized protein n=1 Tax=Portunus trituberculatus TaxID=210409 RepID=A0A5B7IS54_PORTR|nr:hypothetical protein [Portunus trituberculatus]
MTVAATKSLDLHSDAGQSSTTQESTKLDSVTPGTHSFTQEPAGTVETACVPFQCSPLHLMLDS